MGDHTDYNDGFALPCAIDRQTVVAYRVRDDPVVMVVTADEPGFKDQFPWNSDLHSSQGPVWTRYVRGVFAGLRAQGYVLGGIELAIAGDIPQGSGLSSSASLELAVAEALCTGFGLKVADANLARAGQFAEHYFAGCQCGLMDQLVVASARPKQAMLLDCRSLQATHVRLPSDMAIVIIDSKVRRGLVGSEYNLRRRQCEEAARHFGVPALRDIDMAGWEAESAGMDPVLARRAKHVVSENARTLALAQCFIASDNAALHEIFRESHASLRDQFEVSTPAIDRLVDIVSSTVGRHGGARMTGGGFGGCVVALAPLDAAQSISTAVSGQYVSPSGQRAMVYVSSAAGGRGPLLPRGEPTN
jgi:galactokinase